MVKAVKKDTGNVIYMRLMKHNCPVCQKQLKVVKMVKIVKANSREAKQFNFNVCNISLGDKVKFIWYEFKCPECDLRFSEAEMKSVEKKIKKEAKHSARTAEKEQKV